ncbi:L-Ala--D-Glu endopeptidase [Paenibacillus segetis]|uniref:L-Ala--D-Glu endopeptidase n=2 Tax=Paenibacillus segetis TaxID=1325360 RepID=A0ABQ1YQE9_9BACL|nr:M23 family metallopeptidase [Paenibacillus segetis]GGH34801.1 L-Ala--D-Glu endopeptidase [Paenibacillus segetis]
MRSLVLSVNCRIIISLLYMIILSSFLNESGLGIVTVSAEASNKPNTTSDLSIYDQRRNLYEEIEILTQIPWYWIAALDQYERSITPRKEIKKENSRLAGIRFKETMWAGPFNPNLDDKNPATIAMFGGIGQDATADGSADPENDRDSLFSMVSHLMRLGYKDEDLRIALWRYYQNDSAVSRIWQFAKIYKAFGKVDLSGSAFPLPVKSNYTYRDTWGARRGWGGLRIHEGTDLFASSGVPVRSVCYGVVETKGWNPYGGWRIGIRDLNNRYHYYAHLHGYEKKIEIGDIVTPGQTIGWVGSSGYGPPGTQGKFPPHLHYGIYQDTGVTEWAFDPYPLLKRWETLERKQLTNKAAN